MIVVLTVSDEAQIHRNIGKGLWEPLIPLLMIVKRAA